LNYLNELNHAQSHLLDSLRTLAAWLPCHFEVESGIKLHY
jgi:hypothetical protein